MPDRVTEPPPQREDRSPQREARSPQREDRSPQREDRSPHRRDRLRAGVLGLIRSCHPEPTVAVTTGSALLAVVVGHGPVGVGKVTVAVLASQLATGWANDALDADRDRQAGRPDKPVAGGLIGHRTVAVAAVLAALATVPLAALSGSAAAVALAIGLAGGLFYDWPLKRTPFSVLPYLVGFGALAAFVVLALPGAPVPPPWLVGAAALLGGAAHFVNVLPDLDDDARTGVRGLPHLVGRRWSWSLAGLLLGAASATLVFGPPGRPSPLALAILAVAAASLPLGALASRGPGSRAAFRSILVVALADVALLLLSGARL